MLHAARAASEDIGQQFALQLNVVGWELVQPQAGRPQSAINPLVDDCDVFIGILKRKLGSPTGTHESGFIEEFERALARQKQNSSPKIGLFFAEISSEDAEDPGRELKRTLEFRKKIREERLALYKQYASSGDLKAELISFFASFLASEAAVVPAPGFGEISSSPVAEKPAIEASSHEGVDAARREIGANLADWSSLALGISSALAPDRDRLLMFALSINVDGSTIGVHAANRLYRKRADLHPTRPERALWLRSICEDLDLYAPAKLDGFVPGWYFFQEHAAGETLVEIAIQSERAGRSSALDFLQRLQLRPEILWPRSSNQIAWERAVARWEVLFSEPFLRGRVLGYLIEVATAGEPMLTALRHASVGHEWSSAAIAALDALELRFDRLAGLLASEPQPYMEWLASLAERAIPHLTDEHLAGLIANTTTLLPLGETALKALGGRSPRSDAEGIRAVASLLSRGGETQELAVRRILDAGGVPVQWLITAWQALPLENRGFGARVRIAAATTSDAEFSVQLTRSADRWDAIRAISWKPATSETLELARAILREGGSGFANPASFLIEDEDRRSELLDFQASIARAAALRLLSNAPERLTSEGDRKLVRDEVSKQDWNTMATGLLALAQVGEPSDAEHLYRGMRNAILNEDELTLLLGRLCEWGDDKLAREMLADPSQTIARAGASMLVASKSDEVLRGLLYDPSAHVRRGATMRLIERLDRSALAQLSSEYPDGSDSYFYDVVVWLDWELYGPQVHE